MRACIGSRADRSELAVRDLGPAARDRYSARLPILDGGFSMMRSMLLSASLCFLFPGDPVAGPPPRQFILSALPPPPADVEKDISVCKVPLAAAVETAVKAAGGIARSAEVQVANGKPMIRVWIYGGGACKRVDVDGLSGEIISTIDVPRFPGDPVEGDWIETSTGLRYYELVLGTGAKPRDPMAKVKVHYTGWLVDGTQFESSRDRNEPVEMLLNKVIAGWKEGLSTMQVGGKRKLIIPSGLAYGPKGSRSVPPNAVTIFDVELVDVMN